MNGEKANPAATVYPRAGRIARVSRTARPSARGENGRRRSGGRVSGWRTASQTKAAAATTKMVTKIARHPESSNTPCPRAGAMAGTRMNTAIVNDMMRAIGRPAY